MKDVARTHRVHFKNVIDCLERNKFMSIQGVNYSLRVAQREECPVSLCLNAGIFFNMETDNQYRTILTLTRNQTGDRTALFARGLIPTP